MSFLLQRAGSLLIAFATMSIVDVARAQDPVRADALESVLSRAGRAEQGSTNHLALEILGLGADAVERSFGALEKGLAKGSEAVLETPRMRVLLAVFEQAGPAQWRPILDHRLHAAPTRDGLAAVLAVVDHDGRAQDIDTLLRAARLDTEGACRNQFESAITAVLLRDESGFSALEATMPLGLPDVCRSIIAGVEGTRRSRAAELLARWIENQKVLRLPAVQHLSRLVLSLPKPLPPELAGGLRTMLDHGDTDVLPDLLVCLGRMEDDASIPGFLRWLKEGSHAVRQNALWALQNTTCLRFGEDHKAWNTWWNEESTWWDKESITVFSRLRRGTKADKMAALNVIAVRRAWRHRLAAEVATALGDEDTDVACLAARELADLGSPVALDELVQGLDSPSPTLAKAAHEALQRITKRTLPTDPQECRAELKLGP